MPRHDDEYEDDDRPRRRSPRRDDEDDRPSRPRRDRDDDLADEDRPRRRRRDIDDESGPPPRKKTSSTLLVLGIIAGVLLLCCGGIGVVGYLVYDKVQGITGDQQATDANLIRIGLAFHNYHDANGSLPHNSYDPKTNRPLLSWRVHLLPYLNEDALYRQFKLDEPWDSPNNRPLIARMPAIYGSPTANKLAGDGKTYYRGFSHSGAIFEKPRGPGQMPRITFAGIPDGTSNTILMLEAGEAIEWTRPDDIDWSPGRPRPALGGAAPQWPLVAVLMADGSVRRMDRNIDDMTLRNLINRQDGMAIQPGWEK